MKKSRKLWKIETIDHQLYNGVNIEWGSVYAKPYIQLMYDSELDCLLDIVTDECNHGLKVYKHQVVVEDVEMSETLKVFRLMTLSGDGAEWELEKVHKFWDEEGIQTLDERWITPSWNPPPINSYIIKKYYWVEAYMQ
jgi:hypothetical protein